jgi:hypothetical protein
MDETLRHQRDTSLGQLDALIRRGREIRDARSADATRAWQQECAAAINQLSGGSKAHWLARAYSGAFMVRSADGAVIVEADATEIADRILDVLAQGASSLSRMDDVETASSVAAPRPRRFEFVHNTGLRPVFEQAFDDSHRALEQGQFALALILSCGVIDALLTDALEQSAIESAIESATESATESAIESAAESAAESAIESAVRNPQSAMTFDTRISEAERAGLIRGGCARLPLVARRYRDLTDANGELRPDAPVSEREARVAGQVLHVVMRDLDPGR